MLAQRGTAGQAQDPALQALLRTQLMHEARAGRVLIFSLPLVLFLLSPVYGPVFFDTPQVLLLPIRLVSFGLIVPACLLGLYGALARSLSPGWSDLLLTVAGIGVLAGMLALRSIGMLNGFGFPFALICFYVVSILIVARVQFQVGSLLSVWCAAVLIGLEWTIGGFTPEANFNVLTALLVIGVAIYTSRVLEQTALHSIETERRLQELAETDGLTGLLNRRAALEEAAERFRHASRKGERVAVAIADIDHFKAINDRHGHARGDLVIQRLARLVAGAAQGPDDIAARLGGEEFLLLWCDLRDEQLAQERCERLVRDVAAERGLFEGRKVTLTVGLCQGVPARTPQLKQYLAAADAALYEGKRGGRNRVVAAAAPDAD